MVRTGETARVGVLGSHGEVGRQVAALLRASGHMVNCGNRSHHTSDERTAIVDAHDEESVNKFSRDLDVVVNCAGPSCLLKTSVASALPDSVGYIDPFGANSFDNYPTNRPCVVNAGATPRSQRSITTPPGGPNRRLSIGNSLHWWTRPGRAVGSGRCGAKYPQLLRTSWEDDCRRRPRGLPTWEHPR